MTTAMSRLKPSPPVAVMLVVFGFGTAYAQNTPGAVTVPTVMGPVPVTADSYPLMVANKTQNPIDLSKFGYIEEEYFISGRANVHDLGADNALMVKTPDMPYTTRILVRRAIDTGCTRWPAPRTRMKRPLDTFRPARTR